MKTSDFYFDLPEELIAQVPLPNRTDSRLLVLDKETGAITHSHFHQLDQFLRPGDRLVLNDTKVLPARLIGRRIDTAAQVEILLLKRLSADEIHAQQLPDGCIWEALAGPGKRARLGHQLTFGDGRLKAEVVRVLPDGNRLVQFKFEGIFEEILDELGQMPLPPYIHEKLEDRDRYQTVYAREEGSAAGCKSMLCYASCWLRYISPCKSGSD